MNRVLLSDWLGETNTIFGSASRYTSKNYSEFLNSFLNFETFFVEI